MDALPSRSPPLAFLVAHGDIVLEPLLLRSLAGPVAGGDLGPLETYHNCRGRVPSVPATHYITHAPSSRPYWLFDLPRC
ncbi:hypothetical protein KC325_g73 [Hortaea werneckii]|nr:hypothetical protein KC325_g73 [Hortaea werneckii]